MTLVKKLFRHGGSFAVDIPAAFIKKTGSHEVVLEVTGHRISISPKAELDNMESEPLFASFIQALAIDAMKHPQKLRQAGEVWDKEWNALLKGVTVDDK